MHNFVEAQILPKLVKARKIGKDRWTACCPAHDDKTPSFALTIAGDGKVLMKCWAGCDPEAICDALGIQLSDLFPKDRPYSPPGRSLEPTEDTWFIAVYEAAIKRGEVPTPAEKGRYLRAVNNGERR